MDHSTRALSLLAEGLNADEVAAELLSEGATPIATIKALRAAVPMTLGEAKSVMHRNLTAEQQAASEQLWDVVEASLELDE